MTHPQRLHGLAGVIQAVGVATVCIECEAAICANKNLAKRARCASICHTAKPQRDDGFGVVGVGVGVVVQHIAGGSGVCILGDGYRICRRCRSLVGGGDVQGVCVGHDTPGIAGVLNLKSEAGRVAAGLVDWLKHQLGKVCLLDLLPDGHRRTIEAQRAIGCVWQTDDSDSLECICWGISVSKTEGFAIKIAGDGFGKRGGLVCRRRFGIGGQQTGEACQRMFIESAKGLDVAGGLFQRPVTP